MKTQDPVQKWALQAARNSIGILGYLVDPDEEIPIIHIHDMAGRIEAAFKNRATWNQAVHDSHMEGELKLWLVVP